MKRIKDFFKVNPIIVKEIRSRMRGGRAFITLTVILVLMAALMYAMLQIIMASARYTTVLSPQVGQGLFSALAFLVLFMICAVTPAVTAGAISGEKEKQTYEMLMATPMSPTSILWGKLISALSYVFLLLFAAVPLASVVFIYGGVAPADMVKALLVLLVFAVSFGILGLFMSALFGRTGRATVATFLVVVGLMIGPIFIAGLVGVMTSGEPPRWILAPSPISALSAALASSMTRSGPGEIFFLLSGIFNMGISPLNQNSIPRPLYHYTVPFYGLLSVILYMLSTRLVQPTRRWSLRRKELLVGVGTVVLLVGLIAGGYFLTAPRYEWATNPNPQIDPMRPDMPVPLPAVPAVEEKKVVIAEGVDEKEQQAPPPEGIPMGISGVEEHAQVYAAIARQYYTLDHTFGDNPPNWPTLYLIATTDDSTGDPNATKADPLPIDEKTQAAVTDLLADLPAKVVWVNSREEVPMDPQSGEVEQGAIITFGNPHMAKDGTLHVSASLYFASMGATGKTYILSNDAGQWNVIGTTGVEWIS